MASMRLRLISRTDCHMLTILCYKKPGYLTAHHLLSNAFSDHNDYTVAISIADLSREPVFILGIYRGKYSPKSLIFPPPKKNLLTNCLHACMTCHVTHTLGSQRWPVACPNNFPDHRSSVTSSLLSIVGLHLYACCHRLPPGLAHSHGCVNEHDGEAATASCLISQRNFGYFLFFANFAPLGALNFPGPSSCPPTFNIFPPPTNTCQICVRFIVQLPERIRAMLFFKFLH